MSRNTKYAAELKKKLNLVPSVGAKAVAKAAYQAVLDNTVQDSGEAAYNWRAQINTARQYPYRFMRGQYPVGSTGEKRSRGFDRHIVINERMGDFVSRLGSKTVKFVLIYNPMEDPDHAVNAKLQWAQGIATNEGWLDEVAQRAIDAYL